MDTWKLRFLGVPTAYCGTQKAALRSKETWAVLASLMLPYELTGDLKRIARDTLAERFWSDCDNVPARTHLRQAIHSIQKEFRGVSLQPSRDELQLATGWFETDIGQVVSTYNRACSATSAEERIQILVTAEADLEADFLAGWDPASNEAQVWLIHARDAARSVVVPYLILLSASFESVGNYNAAFEAAGKVLRIQPAHTEARTKAWDLANKVGKLDLMHALRRTKSFQDLVVQHNSRTLKELRLSDGHIVMSLFEVEISSLSKHARDSLSRLAPLPGSFRIEIAKEVSNVTKRELDVLVASNLLVYSDNHYAMPALVRDCTLKLMSASGRMRIVKRLAGFCIRTVTSYTPLEGTTHPPFDTPDKARPFYQATIDWVLGQPTMRSYVNFINLVRFSGIYEVARSGIPYLERVYKDTNHHAELRLHAALFASYVFMGVGDNAAAIPPLLEVLPIADLVSTDVGDRLSETYWQATLSATLMMTYCECGEYDLALRYGEHALELYRQDDLRRGEVHCIRYIAEINFHLERYANALTICDEALRRRTVEQFLEKDVADALYWKALILFELHDYGASQQCTAEALSYWQMKKNPTQIGLCLTLIGQIYAQQGRYPEAIAQVEHAKLLFEQASDHHNRIFAIEALGDIMLTSQDVPAARACYNECLTYLATKPKAWKLRRVEAKVLALDRKAITQSDVSLPQTVPH